MLSAPPVQPAAALAVAFPPGISRVPARQLARRELARSIYRPSAWQRIVNAVERWLNSLLGSAGPRGSGWWTLIVLIVVAVLVVSAVFFWIGPAGRARRQRAAAVLAGDHLTAADHRRHAELQAQSGNFAGAIIDRVRAIAVELETRGVLLPRPGRTASELAAEAATALPDSAAALREATRVFDDVRYGGRAGTLVGYEQVRDLDARIQAARTPAVSVPAVSVPAGPGPAA